MIYVYLLILFKVWWAFQHVHSKLFILKIKRTWVNSLLFTLDVLTYSNILFFERWTHKNVLNPLLMHDLLSLRTILRKWDQLLIILLQGKSHYFWTIPRYSKSSFDFLKRNKLLTLHWYSMFSTMSYQDCPLKETSLSISKESCLSD